MTCFYLAIGEEEIERELLTPARQLVQLLQNGKGYLVWLAQSCSRIDKPLPKVAAHNDLTMWNILLGEGSLGIVDWEEAQQEYFPLVDFYYAMTDALLVSGRARSRQKACEAWLAPWGTFHNIARIFFSRFQDTLAIPQDYADLCLHVCFLRHGMNELNHSLPGGSKPFVQTLDWLSLHCTETKGWLHG